jgi:hypothetical protein
MWLFTRYGFYSIACANKPDGSIDVAAVMIRARSADHLKNLQQRFPSLASAELLTWQNRDYRYRLIVSKAVWAAVAGELTRGVFHFGCVWSPMAPSPLIPASASGRCFRTLLTSE